MTQFYIGCKQVLAWEVEKDGLPGYELKYESGLTKWSPKEAFENEYIAQGLDATRISQEMVDGLIASVTAQRMNNTTVVQVMLRNGFSIIEESSCVDPNNYDHELGTKLAVEKAKSKIWNLLGFLLATARNGVNNEPT